MDTTGQNYTSRWYSARECESPNGRSPSSMIGSTSALAPSTPRIDISRASSHSSHHDSRDSSPENVFDQVGTGTLQDAGVLGYREEGTMDLRSSTEELQFMEPEKGKTEKEKPQAQQPYSPVMFKFEEQNSISLHHQRKDSVSSEVAAFLCISGRTSRISSVGSQGSANSKLSAVSDVSRSPSPHRMLLETSFCGPKPLHGMTDGSIPSSIEPSTAKVLEQVILSRKKDPTEAVLAEGISVNRTFAIDNATTTKKSQETELTRRKSDSNANITHKGEIIQLPQTSRSISNKRYIPPTDLDKPIIGIMPSGTEYIRIKLKPDHCYSDNGIADNERILKDDQKKPHSLNLNSSRNKKSDSTESPKLTHHFKLSRENDSRSPSPANNTFSRKSSFCSIFKLKDSANLDSLGSHERKKSGSISHEFRERSRSKSRERDLASLNTTPSKQNSVLAIFKPKKNGAKSKSPSPIDANPQGFLDNVVNVKFKFKNESPSASFPHLRYYDTPLDGKSIHIPLHTPPEEKQFKPLLTNNPVQPFMLQPDSIPDKESPSIQSVKQSNNCIVTIHNRPKPMPPLKCYRIENSDGTITIPLKSPTEDTKRDSIWSMEIQHNSSKDSKATVISVAAKNLSNTLPVSQASNALPLDSQSNQHDVFFSHMSFENEISVSKAVPIVNDGNDITKPEPAILGMSAKEKKQLLFSMKMGSGSQEHTFTTQFSVSKTESQSSQLSETVQTESLNGYQFDKKAISTSEIPLSSNHNKQIEDVKRQGLNERISRSDRTARDFIDLHRHSRYLENSDEILNMLHKSGNNKRKNTMSEESSISQDTSKDESTVKMSSKSKNVTDRKSTASNDEQGVSSESEKDSEMDSSQHLPPNMQNIEDHESAGLVLQESFDDELPYIPTTLPEERAVGVKLVPMKERAQIEMKTYPLERPRSTTPIHPATFENYFGVINTTEDFDGNLIRGEKLRISLPKKHDIDKIPKLRSPRKASIPSGKNWFEFVDPEQTQTFNNVEETIFTSHSSSVEEEPPPLPPRKGSTQQWIDCDTIPEKRKSPKRITTMTQAEPSDNKVQLTEVVYSYVQPEECQCECHENEREGGKQQLMIQAQEIEDEQPLLQQYLLEHVNKR